MKIRKATLDDYIAIQGGMPQVETLGKLTIITHNYLKGEGMVIRSHIDHDTVRLDLNSKPVEFKVDYLRRFHGESYKKQSHQYVGEGYFRLFSPRSRPERE